MDDPDHHGWSPEQSARDGEHVVVRTRRGEDRVPVMHVQAALEQPRREGEVRVTPEAFDIPNFRSSFVGAVLGQLDDVEVLIGPQRVRLVGESRSISSLLERACREAPLPRSTERYSGSDPFARLMTGELRDAIAAYVPDDGSWKIKGSAGQATGPRRRGSRSST